MVKSNGNIFPDVTVSSGWLLRASDVNSPSEPPSPAGAGGTAEGGKNQSINHQMEPSEKD